MKTFTKDRISTVRKIGAGCVIAGGLFFGLPAQAQDAIEPEANAILKAMTEHLKSLKEFSVDYDTDHEVVDADGQKLQLSATGMISLSRSSGFLMTRQGPLADMEVIFDGKTITLFGKALNVYGQLDSPGPSIDEAVGEFRTATGLDATGADLLASDPYPVLTEGVTSGRVVGVGFVDGVECDHLAFRTDLVDWQIWISHSDKPLPVKYVITTKWVTGAPQYTLRLSGWTTDKIDPKLFSFTPPADAKRLESIEADETGEIVLETSK
ncbi:DUF2092 domain-containing protein [Rhizobium sp. TH2]|uniref:DUF2092 domain-containing protein n=1 Tax=Rhizobium sp. TH2 TaxID=2775403 RepID=UPI002158519A|nr:DUF2092 domain-containing protein [Rhizobium sp. TH2]